MPIQLLDRPHVIVTRAERGPDPDVAATVSDAASVAMLAAAGALLLGSLVDLIVLWAVQRQTTPQWEFLALLDTVEAIPRMVTGLAFIGGALYFRRTASLLGYRLIALGAVLLGLVGAVVAGMIMIDYLALSRIESAATEGPLQGVALKGIALGVLYLLILTPLGVLGTRWPKQR